VEGSNGLNARRSTWRAKCDWSEAAEEAVLLTVRPGSEADRVGITAGPSKRSLYGATDRPSFIHEGEERFRLSLLKVKAKRERFEPPEILSSLAVFSTVGIKRDKRAA